MDCARGIGLGLGEPTDRADVRNNLARRITLREGARATLGRNAESVPASWFRAPARLDFHLAPAAAARERGTRPAAAGLDLDGEPRSAGATDLGADEGA